MRAPIITDIMRGPGLAERETQEISVTDPPFRAKGDGVADDTERIQAAIDTAESAGGGLVLFPVGTYKTDGSLTIKTSDITLRGYGYDSKIYNVHASANTIEISKSRCNIENLWIAKSLANRTGVGIYIYDSTGFIQNIKILKCIVSHHDAGVYAKDFTLLHITDSYLELNASYGLQTEKSGANYCTMLYTEHCWIRNNDIAQARIFNVRSYTAIKTAFETGAIGLDFQGGSTADLNGCWFEANTGSAILIAALAGAGEVTATECFFDEAALAGDQAIFLDNSSHLVLRECTVSNLDAAKHIVRTGSGCTALIIGRELAACSILGNDIIFQYPGDTIANASVGKRHNIRFKDDAGKSDTGGAVIGYSTVYANKFGSAENDRIITWGSAAPTAGTWGVGDIVFKTGVAVGGNLGWVCTTAGTPGTWTTFGAIENADAYTPTNVTTVRAFDADSTSITELADVLGTLLADFQSAGIIK